MFGKKKLSRQQSIQSLPETTTPTGRSKYDEKIMETVLQNDYGKLKTLLEKRRFTSLHSRDQEGRIPIVEACKMGFCECVDLLASIELPNENCEENGMHPLHIASEKGFADCVLALLNRGVRVDLTNKEGLTALHIAVENGHDRVVAKLLGYSADINRTNSDGQTSLSIACRLVHSACAVTLINGNANLNNQDAEGRTALMHACEQGLRDVVKALVQSGARVMTEDNEGRTAKDFAMIGGNQACLSELPRSAASGTLKITGGRVQDPEVQRLQTQIHNLKENLHEEKKALLGANNEIEQLKAQLAAFNPAEDVDDDDLFGSDDDIDLETSGTTSSVMVAGQVEALQRQFAKLNEQKSNEINTLKATIESLEAKLKQSSISEASVPLTVVEAIKKDHQDKVEALQLKIQTLQKEPKGINPATKDLIRAYRHFLLLAFEGALPENIKEQLKEIQQTSIDSNLEGATNLN
eukprot:m.252109 g.252109  ORF g.252109 m.252109 type:complete len:467 (+) comp16154_c0_seq19:264-1664(+)